MGKIDDIFRFSSFLIIHLNGAYLFSPEERKCQTPLVYMPQYQEVSTTRIRILSILEMDSDQTD